MVSCIGKLKCACGCLVGSPFQLLLPVHVSNSKGDASGYSCLCVCVCVCVCAVEPLNGGC